MVLFPGGEPATRLISEHQDRGLWVLELLHVVRPAVNVVRLAPVRGARGVRGQAVHGARDRHLEPGRRALRARLRRAALRRLLAAGAQGQGALRQVQDTVFYEFRLVARVLHYH